MGNLVASSNTNLSYNEMFYRKVKSIEYKSVDSTKIKQVLDNYNPKTNFILIYCLSLLEKVFNDLPEFKIEPRGGFRKRFQKYYKPQIDVKKMEKIMDSEAKSFSFDHQTNVTINNTKMDMKNITVEEFEEAFKNVVWKKDFMKISKKFFMMIPEFHRQRLINMFNDMIWGNNSNVEKHAIGISYLIYKEAKNGPMDEYKSYRTIITIPNIVNHFHRILAIRISNYFLNNNLLDIEVSKGSIPGIKYPLLEQILKVSYLAKEETNHIMFIDISNAFPSLNLIGAMQLLQEYKVDNNIISYIKRYYESLEYKTHISRDNVTSFKKWGQGLIQGCPMSPIIFIIVMDYVLKTVSKKYLNIHGSELNGNKILFSAYLDDICISCNSLSGLEEVFTDLKNLLSKFDLKINDDKTKVMSKENTHLKGYERVKSFTYLGETIESGNDYFGIYKNLFKTLFKRIYRIHKATYPNDVKITSFNFFVLPWIQKKLLVYHNLDSSLKENIRKVVQYYLNKWEVKGLSFERTLNETLSYSKDRCTQSILGNPKIKEIDREIIESRQGLKRNLSPLAFVY